MSGPGGGTGIFSTATVNDSRFVVPSPETATTSTFEVAVSGTFVSTAGSVIVPAS